MEPEGNSIKLSVLLKYGLTEIKKNFIIDVRLGSKYLKKYKILRVQ